jgi:hypothetical protein
LPGRPAGSKRRGRHIQLGLLLAPPSLVSLLVAVRRISAQADRPEDVRLWVQAAHVASMPALWCSPGVGTVASTDAATSSGGGGGSPRAGLDPDACLSGIVAAAVESMCLPGSSSESKAIAGAAARLLAAAALAAPGARPQWGGKPPRPRGSAAAALAAGWTAEGPGYVLGQALMGAALAGSDGGAAWGDAAGGAAAWAALRGSAAAGRLRGLEPLSLFILASGPVPRPQELCRGLTLHTARLAGERAAMLCGGDREQCSGIGPLAAHDLLGSLRRPAEALRSAPRSAGHAAWRALAVAALSTRQAGAALRGPEWAPRLELGGGGRLQLAARLAAAAIIAAADMLLAPTGEEAPPVSPPAGSAAAAAAVDCGAAAGPSCRMAVVEAALAATQALVLLASPECPCDACGALAAAAAGQGPEEGADWREALRDARLRGALEALLSLQPPPGTPGAAWGGGAGGGAGVGGGGARDIACLVDAAVTEELRCCAAAALSLCYGQLGVRPKTLQQDADGSGCSERGGTAAALLAGLGLLRLPRGSDWPDVEIALAGAGAPLAVHGIVLSATSPALRERLRAAAGAGSASTGTSGGGAARARTGRLQLRLKDAVDAQSLQLVLDWAYGRCAQLPEEPAARRDARQQLRLLAHGLKAGGLVALCDARMPLPGEQLPRLVADYAGTALAGRGVEVRLAQVTSAAPQGSDIGADSPNGSGSSGEEHVPVSAALLAAHTAASLIPRELPAPVAAPAARADGEGAYSGGSSGDGGVAMAADPFADAWLAAPVLAAGDGAAPAALLLPVHRVLLAARCPYFAAATSSRWDPGEAFNGTGTRGGDKGKGGGEGNGDSDAGGRPLPVVVLPDADEDVAWALAEWMYGVEGGPSFRPPPAQTAGSGSEDGGGGSRGASRNGSGRCIMCRAARAAVRLRHCCESLLLPGLAAACERRLRAAGGLLAGLPARCLAALLRDCAELGLGAAAEAVAERLVELQLHNGESEGLL